MKKKTLIALWNVVIFHVNEGAWLLHPCAQLVHMDSRRKTDFVWMLCSRVK